jgi:outer membrane cobalamin receptor
MNFERLGRRGLLLAACATSVFAAPAFAQQQATTAQDDQPVEEIIVTATRRETALQNVAVAVTAGQATVQDFTLPAP